MNRLEASTINVSMDDGCGMYIQSTYLVVRSSQLGNNSAIINYLVT